MKTSHNPTPPPIASNPPGFFKEIQERIRQRAYELYEARGKGDGHDLEDWLQAEAEITEHPRAIAA